jgi:hypothetical protein
MKGTGTDRMPLTAIVGEALRAGDSLSIRYADGKLVKRDSSGRSDPYGTAAEDIEEGAYAITDGLGPWFREGKARS